MSASDRSTDSNQTSRHVRKVPDGREQIFPSCGERTGASVWASAAAAPMPTLDRPAAEPWLAVVVQVAAARKVRPLAATSELLRLAAAEVATSACAPARRPTAAETLISWAAGSARKPWQCRGTF